MSLTWQNVLQQARSALENTNLTGMPQIRSDLGAENVPPHTGFDMGQVQHASFACHWHLPDKLQNVSSCVTLLLRLVKYVGKSA